MYILHFVHSQQQPTKIITINVNNRDGITQKIKYNSTCMSLYTHYFLNFVLTTQWFHISLWI